MSAQAIERQLQQLLPKLEHKVTAMIGQIGDKSPHVTRDGVYDDMRVDWWTSGFWPGILWIMHDLTGKPHYLHNVWDWDAKIEQCWTRKNNLHHDVGFQFLPTAMIKYKLTGDREARRRALMAATFLAGRFNLEGQFIRAWNDTANPQQWNALNKGWAIIDSMMNLSLLFWATEESGDPRYKQVAMRHADTVMRDFVREDGSVCHIASFDPETGAFIEQIGGQGLRADSAWSRGNAWALYGFVSAYRFTGQVRYLETARKIADYFIGSLEDDGVPIWDFHDDADTPRDTSAASIAASGLLELAVLVADEQHGLHYREQALRMLQSLSERYANWDGDDVEQGILREATGNLPQGENINVSLIYGDYFFVEALAKLCGWERRIF